MAKEGFRVVFDEDGYPRELASGDELTRGIREGLLQAQTLVTLYRSGAQPRAGRAADLEELRPYFAKDTLAAPIRAGENSAANTRKSSPPAPQKIEPAVAPLSRLITRNTAATPDLKRQADQTPPVEEENVWDLGDSTPYETAERWDGRGPSWIKIGCLSALAVFALLVVIGLFGPEQETPEQAQQATYVVGQTTNVRTGPTTDGTSIVGTLTAGDEVQGRPSTTSTGESWLEVASGEFEGRYVWMRNLRLADGSEAANAIPPNAPVSQSMLRLEACSGRSCKVITADGWAGVTVGRPVAEALAAAGFELRRPGAYDDVFADEPGRLESCNRYQVVGAPENIWIFVENGKITSIDASVDDARSVRFTTDRGVALGDTEAKVREAYGSLEQKPDIYSEPPDKKLFFRASNGNGIKFSIVEGKVAEIAAGGESIEYVEGCL